MNIDEVGFPFYTKGWDARLDDQTLSDLAHFSKTWVPEVKATALNLSYEDIVHLKHEFEVNACIALKNELRKKMVDRVENEPFTIQVLLTISDLPHTSVSHFNRILNKNKMPYNHVRACFEMINNEYKEVSNG